MKRISLLLGVGLSASIILAGCSEKSIFKLNEVLPQIESVSICGYYDGSVIAPWELDQSEIEELTTWIGHLSLEHRIFKEGENPGETFAGGNSYTFDLNNGEQSFTYADIDKPYIIFEEEWYEVKNPSDLPIETSGQTKNQIRFGDRMVDAEGLSEETLEWLDWYNSLPEEQQLAISFVPPDLIEESGLSKTEDAKTNEDTICSYPTAENNLGVQLSVANVTPTGLTLICNQSGGEPTGELQTGTAYSLEKDVNGVWQAVEPKEVMGWNDEALIIEKGGKTEWNIGWSLVYGTLPDGKYRIGKDIRDFRSADDYDISICYAEFEIAG